MLENLQHKKIAILGMGVNNLKLMEYFKAKGIGFEVIEAWKSPEELVGKLDNYDVIFRTPGLPYLSGAVQQALKKGVEITSQTKLFFQLCPAPIIGVTGTKGKGTTASLIARILEASGRKTWLAGNIGRDPFEFLDSIRSSDSVIMELSSFQLQDLHQSPHIAVVLNITSDHLTHHKSVDEYIRAKLSIIEHQQPDDLAVMDSRLPDWFKTAGSGKKIFFDPQTVSDYQTQLIGKHYLENIAAAVDVSKLLGVDDATIKKAVAEFEALPHRLKVVREAEAITYIDDAYSTNVEPTIAAIDAIKTPLILITGGYDKHLEFSLLGKKILSATNLKALVVIGQVTDKILAATAGFKGKIMTGARSMPEILTQATSVAEAGDTILFSPATSSFDLFRNETDRGDQFVNVVNQL